MHCIDTTALFFWVVMVLIVAVYDVLNLVPLAGLCFVSSSLPASSRSIAVILPPLDSFFRVFLDVQYLSCPHGLY